MDNEPCLSKCRFLTVNMGLTSYCKLYDQEIKNIILKDEYDSGYNQTSIKCQDCQEKELSVSIDDKIDEMKDLYNVFVYEMDALMNELDKLKIIRRSIYE